MCRLFRFILLIICIGLSSSIANASDSILTKPNLKVLDIGNSYTNDATDMLSLIVKASGSDVSDMCLYKALRSSGSFKNWYDRYYDNDNYDYSISKVLGGINAKIKTGKESGTNGTLFRECLEKEKWDIIIIHQVSNYAPYYDKWLTSTSSGYLIELLNLLRDLQPQAIIGFLLVHSSWDEYRGNTEKSSFERWKLIANSVKRLCEDFSISFVIPYGTAVENLRSSSLNNEYDLTMDGTHCGYGLCRYTAACCYYESLIAPRSGISVLGNSAIYDASNSSSTYPSVSVTRENALIAQKAAVSATNNWYECINPESVDFMYTLTYRVDSVDYRTYDVEYGSPITPEPAPEMDGHTFSGWVGLPDTMPARDVVVTGSFIKQSLVQVPAPSINVVNGEIVFSCEEEGVKYHYEVNNLDSKSGEGNNVKMTNAYKVSVYASKDGFSNSDVVTKEVTIGGGGLKGDVNDDGIVNVVDVITVVDIIGSE